MRKVIVTPGDRYGKLVVIREAERAITSKGTSMRSFECRCDCGNIGTFRLHDLRKRNRATKSCGCLAIGAGSSMVAVAPGDRYGRLIVLCEVEPVRSADGMSLRVMLCQCDCGAVKRIRLHEIRKKKGATKSCGCLRNTIGGLSKHPLHGTWKNINHRCYDENNVGFQFYGGRGISVCPEWRDSFEAFYSWAIAAGWKPGLQIEREDNDGDYSPDNCTIATAKQNARNRRNNHNLTLNGVTMCISAWTELLRLSRYCIRDRLRSGWSVERALTTPQKQPTTEGKATT